MDQSDERVRDYALNGCTKRRAGVNDVIRALNGNAYKCIVVEEDVSYRWSMVDDDLVDATCPENHLYYGKIGKKYYACENNYFRLATDVEIALGVCRKSINDSAGVLNSSFWRCDYIENNYVWQSIDQLTYDTHGALCTDIGEIYEAKSGEKYTCTESGFKESSPVEKSFGRCHDEIRGFAGKIDASYWACSNSGWVQVDQSTYETYQEIPNQVCPAAGNMITAESGKKYGCTNGIFREAQYIEVLFNKFCSLNAMTHTYNGKTYTCEKSYVDEWAWADNGHAYFADNRDDQIYPMRKIGGATWMQKNLNFVYKDSDTDSASYCYNGDPGFCETFGRLYSWFSAKLACPAGWHLPSTEEWNTLLNTSPINGASNGGNLRKNYGSYNFYNFDIIMGGAMMGSNTYSGAGDYAYFWTTSENSEDDRRAITWQFGREWTYAKEIQSFYKGGGFSVRCVKDE